MRHIWNYFVGFLVLFSCQSHQEKTNNDIDNQDGLVAWYENVFARTENDTTSIILDYVFSTDWMQRYIQYIEKNFENNGGDIIFSKDTVESFDCRYWTLAYVDNDTIPEMLLYGGCRASGTVILTQYGGEVYASPKGGCFSYIKGANGLILSQWWYCEDVFGEVYVMKNGRFTELASYDCNTDFVDTSEVNKHGLILDGLKCHYAGGEIGDSVVGISEIELNGEKLGSCFGYNQYVYCPGFDKLKHTLDFLYYSKGNSTYFPIESGAKKLVDIFREL